MEAHQLPLGWTNINNNPFITAAENLLTQSAYVNVGIEADLKC